jgi:hypothetical protein
MDLSGDFLDRTLALGEHVDDVGAPAAREGLGRACERVEQCGFCSPIGDAGTSFLKSSSESLTNVPSGASIQGID